MNTAHTTPAPRRLRLAYLLVAALLLGSLLIAGSAHGQRVVQAKACAITGPCAGVTLSAPQARLAAARLDRRTAVGFTPGVQGGANRSDPRVSARLGAGVVRVEFEIGTPVAEMRDAVAEYATRGISVLLLAGFQGRIPSVAEARSVSGWAREFGPGGAFWERHPSFDADLAVRSIEFGNETSYAYQRTQRRGGDYARRARDAALAIRGDRGNRDVGLLIQADDANQTDDWVAQMYAAVGDIDAYAAGWTVHPYGPRRRWEKRMDHLIRDTARFGASPTIPIDVTEWGLATDNGRCLDDNYGWDRCMTYNEAAAALTATASQMKAKYGSRLGYFMIYHARDLRGPRRSTNREYYFGLKTLGDGDKGAYTAAAEAFLESDRRGPVASLYGRMVRDAPIR